MITLLIWTIWTLTSSVPKKADKFNLSLPGANELISLSEDQWADGTNLNNILQI